jgi:hypothetical protein
MSTYAVSRERRRASRIAFFAVFLIFLTASLSVGISPWLIMVPAGSLVVFVGVFVASRRKSPTQRELLARGVSAKLPGQAIRLSRGDSTGAIRDSEELSGTLRVVDTRLEWIPSPRSSRRGAASVAWDGTELRTAEITPVWGVVPMCLLHVNGARETDVWVRVAPTSLKALFAAAQQVEGGASTSDS